LRLDTPAFNNRTWRRRATKRLIYAGLKRTFDHFLPVGSASTEFLLSVGVDERKMTVFPYTVDLDHFRQGADLARSKRPALKRQFGLRPDLPVIVSVAKFVEREAPWDLLRGYRTIQGSASLWLIGDGPCRDALEETARGYGYENVVFGGYVPYSDLPTAYGVSDAFVHAANNEPWGVSVQEALAAGLPALVSSGVGAGPDFVSVGENGFVYAVGNDDELGHRLLPLLELSGSDRVHRATSQALSKCEYPPMWQGLTDLAARLRATA
jgi:glycosyltransferase involved in cell wall biosynthesis